MKDPTTVLPLELIDKIFTYLEPKDIRSAELVSKHWLTLFLLDETLSQTESGLIRYQDIAEKYPTLSLHFEINSERFCAIFAPLITRFSSLFAPTYQNSTPLPSQANTAPALEDSDTQSPGQMPNKP